MQVSGKENPYTTGDICLGTCFFVGNRRVCRKSALCRFNAAKDLHFLDVDVSKQGKEILGKIVEPPESLLNSDPEKSAVVITSVLYKDKIIESLQAMGFRGKYYMAYQK